MPITTLLDPTLLPARTMDEASFNAAMAYLMTNLPIWGGQMNEMQANLNSISYGGAYALPYNFSSSASEVDPGSGKLGLSSAPQTSSVALRVNLTNSAGVDSLSLLNDFGASTSAVTGTVRLVKQGDPSKWLVFNVTAAVQYAGYMRLTVVGRGGSSASPFVAGDALILAFQRTGDVGSRGQGFTNMVVMTSTGTWQPPAGITKARVTVQDGGQAGATNASAPTIGGRGGNAGVSVVTVDPAVTYTATVGSGATISQQFGGASSFSGTGITTLTSSNAALKYPGGPSIPTPSTYGDAGGSSLMSPASWASDGIGYGGGGSGAPAGGPARAGKQGVVIIEY